MEPAYQVVLVEHSSLMISSLARIATLSAHNASILPVTALNAKVLFGITTTVFLNAPLITMLTQTISVSNVAIIPQHVKHHL